MIRIDRWGNPVDPDAIIIGRALYERRFSLEDALAV